MSRLRGVIFAAILAFLCAAFQYTRATAADENLTVESAIELAARESPDVLRAREAVESASGRKLQAESFADPRLIYEAEEARSLNSSRFGDQKMGVSQSFELFGKRGLRGRIAAADVEVARQELTRAVLLAVARTRRAYWSAVAQADSVAHIETTRDLLQSFLEATRVRFEGGSASYADVARAKLEIAKAENELAELRVNLENAKSALNVLMGRPGETPVRLASPMRFVAETRTLNDLRSTALRERPSIRIADAQVQKQEKSRSLARRSYLPDLELTGAYERIRSEELAGAGVDNAWAGEIALTFPFPGAKRQRGLVREAQAERRRALIAREAAVREVSASVEQAYRRLRAAELQTRRFEESLLPDAKDALRSGIDAYQYGQIDSLSMLDIYRIYKETQIAHTRSLLALLTARADLEAAGEEEENR